MLKGYVYLIVLFITKISHMGVQEERVALSGLEFDHGMHAIGRPHISNWCMLSKMNADFMLFGDRNHKFN